MRNDMNGIAEIGFDDLEIDVFEVEGRNLKVESLTAGHGMTDLVASCDVCACVCSCTSCCSG